MNRKWIFKAKPTDRLLPSHFEWHQEALPEPGPGQFLVRNIYLSMDPAMRAWAGGDSYISGVQPGSLMRGRTIGVVEKSNLASVPTGTFVSGMLGWQDYALSSGNDLEGSPLRSIPSNQNYPLTSFFSLFGIVGYTAYFGVLDICKPAVGETFVVSAAAGAAGSLAGQIARIKGCKVIGIAGSDEKCSWLVDDLGFDGAINYRKEHVSDRLQELCPKGIDIYFENVGGKLLDIVLERMKLHGRVAVCGLISQYNTSEPGPLRFMDVLMKRLRVEGFICRDYLERAEEADREFKQWISSGQLKYRAHVVHGLEKAPEALNMLFEGGNFGKLILQISEEPGRG